NPSGFVERQVTGWTKRYGDARTDDVPEMERVGAWLAAHIPPSPRATIIHNDFKYDNVVLDPGDLTRIIGILDLQMATMGDPLLDLGAALCYWGGRGDPPDVRERAFGPTMLPGSMSRRDVAERYAARTGRDLTNLRFYYAFGLYKTAVVLQQIYYRYKQGLTKDERFASLGQGMLAMARQAARELGL